MSNKYICPVCGKLQVIVPEHVNYQTYYGGNKTYYTNAICKVCGWKYEDDSSDQEKDPSVIYDRACYEYEKAKQGAIDATQRLASAASNFVKGNSTTDKLLEEIIAELKEIKHALSTTPPYFKTPNITCSSGEINLCSTCAHYNSPIGQCERGVAGCKYEPDERERY